ncbi:hypothetical protein [Aquimarina algiphila]|uniref:Uncharacterized protein n=1 Tax=Aquimarina algiphila TaxID=2047982 RepID=A0A554VJM5_9FLAO|nr:hypothetical protein [Aquimarina algiphila]TSE08120.1 hypothetical protein FOF46_13770 [Aquimarina algiphila]
MENKIENKVIAEPSDILNRIVYGDMNPLSLQEKKDLHYALSGFIQDAQNYGVGIDIESIERLDQTKARFLSYEELLNSTLINAKNEIREKVTLCNDTVSEIKNIIKIYQLKFTDAINSIETLYLFTENRNAIYSISNEKSSQDILKATLNALGKLLCFIEKEYSTYIDNKLSIPRQLLIWFAEDNKNLITELTKKVDTLKLPYHLDIILTKTLEEPLYLYQKETTYEEKEYFIKFLNMVSELIENIKITTHQYCIFLISMEIYPSLSFSFITNFINDTINTSQNNQDKIDILSNYQKELETIPRITSFSSYANGEPMLKEQLKEWIQNKVESIPEK